MHRILVRPDIRLIQKPDNGYPVGSNIRQDIQPDIWWGRISGRIFCSIFKCLQKFEQTNKTDFWKGAFFYPLAGAFCLQRIKNQNYLLCMKTSELSRYSDIRFFSIRYPAGYPASQIQCPPGFRISKRADYPAGYPVHP
jgi:hypothetical protein